MANANFMVQVLESVVGSKLQRAKKKLKNALLEYYAALDECSCGTELATYMSTRVQKAKKDLKEAHAEAKELDSTCPDLKLD